PSPLLPETGDEKVSMPAPPTDKAKPETEANAAVTVRIDVDRIGQRILALNIPASDYGDLMAGPAGTIFYTEPIRAGAASAGGPEVLRLHKFQLKERVSQPFLEGIRSYTLSADRKKLLYAAAGGAESRSEE